MRAHPRSVIDNLKKSHAISRYIITADTQNKTINNMPSLLGRNNEFPEQSTEKSITTNLPGIVTYLHYKPPKTNKSKCVV